MAELKQRFPAGLDYTIVYDPTVSVRESIHEVQKTLFEAIALVVLVVLIFLQTWRAAIIPLIAIPVSLIGTFAAMKGFGFSINNLSLFCIVLAIGIVVDDAIVVVEAIEHHIEDGLSPRDAARKAMTEVGGALLRLRSSFARSSSRRRLSAALPVNFFGNSRLLLRSRPRSRRLTRSRFHPRSPRFSFGHAAR